MKKIISLLKATMTSGMNIFNIKLKGSSSKYVAPLLAFLVMFSLYGNAEMIFEGLAPLGMGYVGISMFVFMVAILVLFEGIYKSGELMFNCKDDQLLLSLPIKRSTVLFSRIFKFYVFEVIYHFLFFAPAVASYFHWFGFSWSFLFTSIVMLLVLPIIPIIISCIIGALITGVASRFKKKSFLQILGTIIVLVAVMALSFGAEAFLAYVAENAKSVNEILRKIYYPAGVYADLIIKFDIVELLVFVLINIAIFAGFVFVLSKVYFKINSRMKGVLTTEKTKKHKTTGKLSFKSRSQVGTLIRKEFNTFFKIPVFLMNAGMSSLLYVGISIVAIVKSDALFKYLEEGGMQIADILANVPIYHFLLILFVALSTSITSSMISLEGKKLPILKSLPVSTEKILRSKIYASLLLSIPALLIGDIILFAKFQYGIIEFLLILACSILLPILSSVLGLLINLKFPKLDAENNTQIVKQSLSSFISVTAGMIIIFSSIFVIVKLLDKGISVLLIIMVATIITAVIDLILYKVLNTYGVRRFRRLN